MNTNELYKEYARVIKMCEGTELEDTPWQCVKLDNIELAAQHGHPKFDDIPKNYKFAVAVLEGRPVFENDIVYRVGDGFEVFVERLIHDKNDRWQIKIEVNNNPALWTQNMFRQCFTWTRPTPKRTFTLNGVELPCPDPGLDPLVNGFSMGIEINGYGESFAYASHDDAEKVFKYLKNLLTEARDKP